MSAFSRWLRCFGELLYPPYCEGCGVSTARAWPWGEGRGWRGIPADGDGAAETMLCEACASRVVPLSRHEGMACLRCSRVFAGSVRG